MAETTKKFLDFTGLQKYDELLKAKVAADIKVVKDDLDTRKVKDTDNSDTITWSKDENGTYTASVKGVVLDDADYTAVKTNATQSAAAWTKFLEGITNLYPDNVAPALKDLATKTEVTDGDASTLASAKSYADSKVDGKFDTVGSAAQALKDAKAYADGLVKDAEGNVKFDAVGSATTAKNDAIKAAKDYADGAFDAKGSAATAEQNAKTYADSLAVNYDAAGSAATAKAEAISEANSHTNTEIGKVNDKIAAINTSIAGGVHFRGVVTELPGTGYTNGDIVIVGNKEYILNKPTDSEGAWAELGDTTAESQRITALEGHVNTLIGGEDVGGSVNNAIKVAKGYTDSEIIKLVNSGQVKTNTEAIKVLNGDASTTGSVAKALADAKAYADTKKSEANSYTDGEITKLKSPTGQVGINTAAIATLNANAETVDSVDYKIAQAVSNIEASIDTISETDIAGLFK